MHYSVPQFIEVEDKIIGPLTMKQFLWLLMGGGIIFILYFTLKFGVWVLVSLFIMAIFSALAFFKIYNMPLHAFIASFARYSLMPQIFIWQKKVEGPLREITEKTVFTDSMQAAVPQKPRPVTGRIRTLAWQLDMKGEAEQR